ncbi:lachesin [Culex quinquefasciatus]|uniref:Lachesin n=1 Tax=Culex quinquefasciatus TaxID=7176 RepID=B0WPE7_CULQU|nr:lachesin [Culex quinquefasciatus]|eukprot:XP_001850581.1 lachesin [Culex quinquefasciatus]
MAVILLFRISITAHVWNGGSVRKSEVSVCGADTQPFPGQSYGSRGKRRRRRLGKKCRIEEDSGTSRKNSEQIMNNSTLGAVLLALLFCLHTVPSTVSSEVTVITDPKFSAPIANVTAAVGREATLTCVVHDLGAYKFSVGVKFRCSSFTSGVQFWWIAFNVDWFLVPAVPVQLLLRWTSAAVKLFWRFFGSADEEDCGDNSLFSKSNNQGVVEQHFPVISSWTQEFVAWLRVDTQTILTIQNHVITKNKRIGILYTEKKTWQLRIRDIRESDKGWYMCQINTDPMKSQTGYLDVVVPPDILDYPTSTDMVVREGSNVTLRCAATGSPAPTIVWRREGGENISLQDGELATTYRVALENLNGVRRGPHAGFSLPFPSLLSPDFPSVEGPTFSIPRVNRLHMGAYLCIASNGVPPSVSKRVMLIVHFPPMIWVPNQLVGAIDGQRMTLECHSEAYPKSINYWTREKGDIVPQDRRYVPPEENRKEGA